MSSECGKKRPFFGLQVSKGKFFPFHTMKAYREKEV
jgi:hypothetical protein